MVLAALREALARRLEWAEKEGRRRAKLKQIAEEKEAKAREAEARGPAEGEGEGQAGPMIYPRAQD